MINIGLLGCGTIGTGVYEIINGSKGDDFSGKMRITRILDLRLPDIKDAIVTDDFEDIINDDSIRIIVSVMGGTEPEYTYIKRALAKGRHVVTANKNIISRHIDELLALAKENSVVLMFEAAVGGGIPIIASVIETLKINKINKIYGILNGTTNYILTKVSKEKRSFEEVLTEAQAIGFAEADPSSDIDGLDIMRKICILSSMAFKTKIREEEVHIRGIGNVTAEDIQMAASFGYNVKYIAQGFLAGDQYSVSVTPVLVHNDSVVSNVNEENNIILISGDVIGELCFIGKGAGRDATANAVVADVLKVIAGKNDYSDLRFDAQITSSGIEGIVNEYFIRVSVTDYNEFSRTLNVASKTFNRNQLQYCRGKIFFITEKINSTDMKKLYENLKKVSSDVFYARLENNII